MGTDEPRGPDARGHSSRTRGSEWILLVSVYFLALALRLYGSDALLPHSPEPDAVLVDQAEHFDEYFAGKSSELDVINPQYPVLLAAAIAALPGRLQETVGPASLEQHLERASRSHATSRRTIAWLAAAIAPLTYLLARQFLPLGWSLAAGLLMAGSLLSCLYGSQARPHAPLAMLCILTVLAALRFARCPSVRGGFALGVAAALAVACLHNGAAVLPAVVVAHLSVFRRREHASWLRACATGAPIALGVLLAYSSFWNDYPNLGVAGAGTLDLTGHLVGRADFDGSGFVRLARGLWSCDPLLLALAAVGSVVALVGWRGARDRTPRAKAELWIVLAFALPYLLVTGTYAWTFGRFALPLLPYVALLAALALRALAGGPGRRLPALAATAAAAIVLTAMVPAARYAWLRGRADTVELAVRWLEEHEPAQDERILLSSCLVVPAAYPLAMLEAMPRWMLNPWERYQLVSSGAPGSARAGSIVSPLALPAPGGLAPRPKDWYAPERMKRAVACALPRYVLVSRAAGSSASLDCLDDIALSIGAEVVARFGTRGAPGPHALAGAEPADAAPREPLEYDLERDGWRRVLAAERLGPVIEIYRMPQDLGALTRGWLLPIAPDHHASGEDPSAGDERPDAERRRARAPGATGGGPDDERERERVDAGGTTRVGRATSGL